MRTLKWWFIFVASIVGLGTAAAFGLVQKLWAIDETKISFLIIILYFGVSAWIGWLTYHCERFEFGDAARAAAGKLDQLEENSDLCMRLAIIGTCLGFAIMVAGAFSAGTIVTLDSIAKLAKGLSLIYLVTAVGVLCSSLLNQQIVNLRALTSE